MPTGVPKDDVAVSRDCMTFAISLVKVGTPIYSWFGRLLDLIGEPNTPVTPIGLPRGPGSLPNQLQTGVPTFVSLFRLNNIGTYWH